MNSKLYNFIITLVLAIIFSVYMPWWSVMLAAFISALIINLKRAAIFYIPFLAVALFWAGYAFILSNANNFILAKKIAELFSLGGNYYLLILITALIGGFAAGVAGMFAHQVRYTIR